MKTYLSIDRGASNTDFAVVDSDYRILLKRCITTRQWDSIMETYREILNELSPDYFVFTGSSNNMPTEIEGLFFKADEIESIAFGGAHAASKERCIIVSMGTGTAVVLFDHGKVSHVGGTGIGGGTMMGLGKLLIEETDPLKINHLAEKGKASELNLVLSEIGYSEIGFLDNDLTVSNFGNLKSKEKANSAAAIQCMIAEVVGVVASLTARQYHLEEDIVITGNLSNSVYIREQLSKVGDLYKTKFIFPENPEYLTAIGAVRSFRKTQSAKKQAVKQ
jgi:type II pantothenate kinase